MKKILLLGRGGAGKSTLAHQLGRRLDIPVIEIDKLFWSADLTPLSKDDWTKKQKKLCDAGAWIIDGDLGKYDALPVRLQHCDTIVLLDFPLMTCMYRAFRRSRERIDFWHWLITWRRLERPKIMQVISEHAPDAELIILRNQKAVDTFLNSIEN